MNRLSTLSLRPHQTTLPMASLPTVLSKALVAVIATASLCAHAQTPPREPSVPYGMGSDKLLLLGKQLLINSATGRVALQPAQDPNLIVAGQRLDIRCFFRSVPDQHRHQRGWRCDAGGAVKAGDTVPVGSALKLVRAALRFRLADGSQIKNHAQHPDGHRDQHKLRCATAQSRTSSWFSGLMRRPVRWKRWRQKPPNARPVQSRPRPPAGVRGTGSA
jgi:hypothetical protein